MQSFFGFILLAIFILVVVLWLIYGRRPELTTPCPNCESINVIEINRETTGTRMVERVAAGTGAGGDIRLQLDLALTFRCQECEYKFTHTFTETQ